MIHDKNRIIRLYLDGYKACDIARIINEKPRTVQRIIREFKLMQDERQNEIFENVHKKNKALKKENNKFISDTEVARHNKSVYKVNMKGDWVLDVENNCVPLDMPMIIKNNEKREYDKTFIRKVPC
ncbi:DUF1670 domain-containing protein [Clostridium sp. Sa3CUN1]|uniref:DUF1670 domain-containing protein n=1 Tax=Clostridium gallinarum TaxID=2762246 RepID=A0ABR8Q627_9CLOT|nr:DUF1670 domain-containing protein [Clostridium gallinarum]MBD7915854.1 DUF1670 domain-containing protein [Clostridium gallinarum]